MHEYAADYVFSLHYFSFIIMSVCVSIIFQLIITKFTLYPLLDYMLLRIVPVYLLRAYKQVFTHITYMKIP